MEITNQNLLAKIADVIGPGEDSRNDKGLTVNFFDNSVIITHAQMYGYLSVNFETMDKLYNIFGSKKIHVDPSYHYDGCETCDYGSRYFTCIRIDEVDISKCT